MPDERAPDKQHRIFAVFSREVADFFERHAARGAGKSRFYGAKRFFKRRSKVRTFFLRKEKPPARIGEHRYVDPDEPEDRAKEGRRGHAVLCRMEIRTGQGRMTDGDQLVRFGQITHRIETYEHRRDEDAGNAFPYGAPDLLFDFIEPSRYRRAIYGFSSGMGICRCNRFGAARYALAERMKGLVAYSVVVFNKVRSSAGHGFCH